MTPEYPSRMVLSKDGTVYVGGKFKEGLKDLSAVHESSNFTKSKVAILKDGAIQHYYDLESLKESIGHIKVDVKENKALPQNAFFDSLAKKQHFENGFTAKILQPIDQSNDLHESDGITIQKTPMSLEDWYLEISND